MAEIRCREYTISSNYFYYYYYHHFYCFLLSITRDSYKLYVDDHRRCRRVRFLKLTRANNIGRGPNNTQVFLKRSLSR